MIVALMIRSPKFVIMSGDVGDVMKPGPLVNPQLIGWCSAQAGYCTAPIANDNAVDRYGRP